MTKKRDSSAFRYICKFKNQTEITKLISGRRILNKKIFSRSHTNKMDANGLNKESLNLC